MCKVRARLLPFDSGTDAPQPQVAASVRDGMDTPAEGETLVQPELSEDMVAELGRILGEMFVAEYRGEHAPLGKTRSGN